MVPSWHDSIKQLLPSIFKDTEYEFHSFKEVETQNRFTAWNVSFSIFLANYLFNTKSFIVLYVEVTKFMLGLDGFFSIVEVIV